MKIKTRTLVTVLFFCFLSSALAQEKNDIVNLAIPKESKKEGWQLSADASKSDLKIGWTDTAGQKYSTPIAFYEYPNGSFGAIAKILGMENALPCSASLVPLARIQKMLPIKGTIEIIPESPISYKGYSLLNVQRNPTQMLDVTPVGKNKEQLAFSAGTLYLVFPGGSPQTGIEMLSAAPGTRLTVYEGAVSDKMILLKGTLVIEAFLKEIFSLDGGTKRLIKNVLCYKVSVKGKMQPEIVMLQEK